MRPNVYVWPDRSHPDWRAARADLRAASCLASGVDLDDIDPRLGFDISRSAYESVRSQWQGLLAADADNQWTQQSYREVRAMWLAYRPEWDDDWQQKLSPNLIPLFELESSR